MRKNLEPDFACEKKGDPPATQGVHLMGCPCKGEFESFLACQKVPGARPIDLATMQNYAHRVGTNPSSTCYVLATLKSGRLPYSKRSAGDCDQDTKLQLGTGVYAGKIAGYVGTAAGAAEAGAGVAGAATGAVASAASIFGLAALPFAIWGLFSAHHAVAVAKEQATVCAVSVAWNNFEAGMEAALAAGKIDLKAAQQQVRAAVTQLVNAMKPIYKTCNLACGVTYAVRALGLYDTEVYYAAIAKQAPLLSASGLKQNWKEILAGGAVAVVGATQA